MIPVLSTICCLAVAFTSGHVIPHIPSGSVGTSPDGVLITGPAGSVHTSNGLLGHAAGVRVSGLSGQLDTRAGHVILTGPGHRSEEEVSENDGVWTSDVIFEGPGHRAEEEHDEDDHRSEEEHNDGLDALFEEPGHRAEEEHGEDDHRSEEEHNDGLDALFEGAVHRAEGQWDGKQHNEEDGLWKSEKHIDWNNDEEQPNWDAEEEQWDKEETDEHASWNHGVHRLVKRQEGRWNKDLERYEITSPRSNDGNNAAYSNDDDYYSPLFPAA